MHETTVEVDFKQLVNSPLSLSSLLHKLPNLIRDLLGGAISKEGGVIHLISDQLGGAIYKLRGVIHMI